MLKGVLHLYEENQQDGEQGNMHDVICGPLTPSNGHTGFHGCHWKESVLCLCCQSLQCAGRCWKWLLQGDWKHLISILELGEPPPGHKMGIVTVSGDPAPVHVAALATSYGGPQLAGKVPPTNRGSPWLPRQAGL